MMKLQRSRRSLYGTLAAARRNDPYCLKSLLMYRVLSVPTYTGKEHRMIEFLMDYARDKGYDGGLDEKGNVYMCKGAPPNGGYYPCVTAHMDTVQYEQIPFIEAGVPIPLVTEEVKGKHRIYAEDFGLGGDDKAGIVIALTLLDKLPICKAVFFVEEESGCYGSRNTELTWFKDVGYVIAFDSPEGNCASWSCSGECLFDRAFYETYLVELGEMFGLTKYVAHPYTDAMVLRIDTALMCMNFGAGYYKYHTLSEYCIAEEMDNAAAMGLYLINRLGYKEYVFPYAKRSLSVVDDNYEYFSKIF